MGWLNSHKSSQMFLGNSLASDDNRWWNPHDNPQTFPPVSSGEKLLSLFQAKQGTSLFSKSTCTCPLFWLSRRVGALGTWSRKSPSCFPP